jgi:hydrogenase maturation protease
MKRSLLIAGIGNMFFGDDAFGCEVIKRLLALYPEPSAAAELRDYGVSVRALGYELAERSSSGRAGTTVIVDAVATGAAPGSLQLFDLATPEPPFATSVSHHALGLGDALTLAVALGASLDGTYLLGCEPACLEPSLSSELTSEVEIAARRAVDLLQRLIEQPGEDLIGLCRNERPASKTL